MNEEPRACFHHGCSNWSFCKSCQVEEQQEAGTKPDSFEWQGEKPFASVCSKLMDLVAWYLEKACRIYIAMHEASLTRPSAALFLSGALVLVVFFHDN
jgi:hypothetical protein